MSKEKEARNARRHVREMMKDAQPLKVVPSKKGLAFAFGMCIAWGFAIGILLERIWRHFHQ